jgi:CubicO group peptidase (beta-lactamase class C family)
MLAVWPALALAAASGGLGPGDGPWKTGSPASHGLDSSKLTRGADNLGSLLPERYCTVVVKDGEIVQETTYTNSSITKYESDSAGKTIIAMLVGAVQHATHLDLDKPLASFGIKPIAGTNWAPSGVGAGFWPRVTARHLLGQTSGFGLFEPGTVFTYDSDDYIQHLSLLIRHATNMAPADWAEEHFAKPLGLSGLFQYDGDVDGEISAGGGQFISCRGLARVGQLYINRGLWPMTNGSSQRLVSAEYIQQMGHPSFPTASANYGLLTWLPGAKPTSPLVQCCNSRFQCPDVALDEFMPLGTSMIGAAGEYESEMPSAALADELAMGLGWLGKWMLLIPSENVTVVTLGNTWGSTVACGLDIDGSGYDESYSVTVLWRQVREMLGLKKEEEEEARNATDTAAQQSAKAPQEENQARFVLNDRTLPFMKKKRSSSSGSVHVPVRRRQPGHSAGSPPTGGGLTAPDQSESAEKEHKGSCQCLCPPDQGFGICVNASSSKDCEHSALVYSAAQSCPRIGVIKECQDYTPSQACPLTPPGSSLQGYFGLSGCPPTAGSAGSCGSQAGLHSPLDPLLGSRSCSCGAERFMRPINATEIFPLNQGGCYWIPDEPCDANSPYYPPAPYPDGPAPAPAPSSPAERCAKKLDQECHKYRKNVFECATCAGQHQLELKAGCTNTVISEWCAEINPPTAPPPPPLAAEQ